MWAIISPGGMSFTRKLDATPKLAHLPKPYCYPILTEMGGRKRKSCFRWMHLPFTGTGGFMDPTDRGNRRHYGGESLVSNGVNWLFADGHVQWHSATYAGNQLLCCIGYDAAVVAEGPQIEAHCKRQ